VHLCFLTIICRNWETLFMSSVSTVVLPAQRTNYYLSSENVIQPLVCLCASPALCVIVADWKLHQESSEGNCTSSIISNSSFWWNYHHLPFSYTSLLTQLFIFVRVYISWYFTQHLLFFCEFHLQYFLFYDSFSLPFLFLFSLDNSTLNTHTQTHTTKPK
jgi:hypothetical protein